MKKLAVLYVVVVVLAIIGEVKCIVKFINSDFEPSYKREAIYGVSAICGVGAVIGWFDFPDEKPTK